MSKVGRPRDTSIETVIRHCPTHGDTDHRRHANGTSPYGARKYRYRCLQCHNEANKAAYRATYWDAYDVSD